LTLEAFRSNITVVIGIGSLRLRAADLSLTPINIIQAFITIPPEQFKFLLCGTFAKAPGIINCSYFVGARAKYLINAYRARTVKYGQLLSLSHGNADQQDIFFYSFCAGLFLQICHFTIYQAILPS
jgi:hypothetical protein